MSSVLFFNDMELILRFFFQLIFNFLWSWTLRCFIYIVDSFAITMLNNPKLITLILHSKCNCCLFLTTFPWTQACTYGNNLPKLIALIYPQIKKNPLSRAYKRYLSQSYVDKNEIWVLWIVRKHIGAYTFCVLLIDFQTFNRLTMYQQTELF